MPKTPQDRKPPAHVQAGRRQAALNAYQASINHRRDVQTFKALAANDDHPMTVEAAEEHEALLPDLEATAKKAAKFAGTTVSEIEKSLAGELLKQTRERVEEWKRLRDQHEDMATFPEEYGYKDLGGADLDVNAQEQMVREYDAHIASAEDEIVRLEGITKPKSKKSTTTTSDEE